MAANRKLPSDAERRCRESLFKDLRTCGPSGGFRGPRKGRRIELRARDHSMCGRSNLGGEYRARTGDLLVANQALSQLS
jgi:hypothetical protein